MKWLVGYFADSNLTARLASMTAMSYLNEITLLFLETRDIKGTTQLDVEDLITYGYLKERFRC